MSRNVWILLFLGIAGCDAEPVADAPAAVGSAPDPAVEALATMVDRTTALADSIDRLLRPMPLMRPAEEASLRRFLNDAHLASARELGVRVRGQEHLESLVDAGTLVPLEDSTQYWVLRGGPEGRDFVVPHTVALLEEIGRRFQSRLQEMGLPPYRMEITSTLRTGEQQAELRQRNPNAAAGVSSHEFGTTVDILYTVYPPPAELPESLRVEASPEMAPHLRKVADLALEGASARWSREIQAILGGVLRDAQSEGLVRVIMEQLQPVYHITVARALAT